MSNVLITPSVIAKEALMQLENNLVMGAHVHKEYKKEFVKVGSTVNIRKPVKFAGRSGATLSVEDVSEAETSITVGSQKGVDWAFQSSDMTLTIEDYSERYIKPAMQRLAQFVNTDLAGLYKYVWNLRGTPGTTPSAFTDLSACAQLLDEGAVPSDDRVAVWNPAAGWKLADGLKGVYVQDIARKALQKGMFGSYANFDNFQDQSIINHTVGALGGTPLVNGASQSVSYPTGSSAYSQSLVTDGWTNTTGAVKQGDVITIANVFAVNPQTFQSTGALQGFVVGADATADGSGNMTITISPPIIISGAHQTVTAAPADNAAITIKTGTASTAYPQNLLFHPNAFALVTVPMELPDGAVFKARETYKGLSIRVIKAYDYTNDKDIIRTDILYGVKAIYPELACRATG
jgi:hypothetical protein